jgi:formate hydrogenlyase subunit 3
MLGLVIAQEDEARPLIVGWLGVAWLSLGGLVLALMINLLPLALLVFLASAMVWALGLPWMQREISSQAVMRYAALLALVMPLLLSAFRLAMERTSTTPHVEQAALALAVPGFGLVLGLIPLHAWALTLASGTPRAMLFGVLTLVLTAGYVLLFRTLADYAWMLGAAQGAFIVGGAVSALVGGWLALSARLDDPDDFLVYAVVANGGMLLAGLGARSATAGTGVALMLFARVLALILLALAPRAGSGLRRWAYGIGILALAGMPGLAGFPGLWVVLRRLHSAWAEPWPWPSIALVAASFLLFATAVRRWSAPESSDGSGAQGAHGAQRAVWALLLLLVAIGVAPQLITPAFEGALRGIFFPLP